MSEWVRAETVPVGALVETKSGLILLCIPPAGRNQFWKIGSEHHPGIEEKWLEGNILVRPIDLPFLMTVSQDKLGENEAYQRGLRAGSSSPAAFDELSSLRSKQMAIDRARFEHMKQRVDPPGSLGGVE